MIAGDVITILKPVCPQKTGLALINKVENFGELRYEVEQGGTKQWYKESQICEYVPNQDAEAWNEYEKQNRLCDQYKEAISEVVEDLKFKHSMEQEERIKRPELSNKSLAELVEDLKNGNYGLRVNSTSTGVEPCMIGRCWSISGNPSKADISANYTIEHARTIKKALALLAEQKQNELKEIEELIKKL